jgi:transposase InsO family protein
MVATPMRRLPPPFPHSMAVDGRVTEWFKGLDTRPTSFAAVCLSAAKSREYRRKANLHSQAHLKLIFGHYSRSDGHWSGDDYDVVVADTTPAHGIRGDHGVVCSMARSGNVWDNGAMESFSSSLKTERTVRNL